MPSRGSRSPLFLNSHITLKSKTYLVGKDAALEDTIEKATELLAGMDLGVEPVSWLNPAPNCWSVHLQVSSCPHLYTNGKGTSRQASLASGLGEFFERLSTNFFFSDFYLGDRTKTDPFYFYPDECWFSADSHETIPQRNSHGVELLNRSLRKYYNPHGELCFHHLVDNNIGHSEPAICALPFISLATSAATYFPVSILNNLYVSNGMAAGNTAEECCSQALSEIIERYVKNIIISRGVSLPDVPGSHLEKYPKLCTILKTLKKHGLVVQVKDASLGGQFPVICALLADEMSGGVFAAFGANCRFEIAVERTLTELLQGRDAEQLKQFQPPCHDIQLVADPVNLESHFVDSDGLLSWHMFADKPDYGFSAWDFEGTSRQEFMQLQQLITQRNFEIFRSEYLYAGMYCCRMVVPGMSEIYPVDDLVWNNRNSGNLIRPLLLKMNRMGDDELSRLLLLVESENFNDQQLISHTIGVLFDDQSAWSTMRIGELKALLFLAIGDKPSGLEWCNWVHHYGHLPERRGRLYRLLETLLNFDIHGEDASDYSKILQLFHGEEELRQAEEIVAGALTFPDLSFGGCWTEISGEHRNLLNIYQSLKTFK